MATKQNVKLPRKPAYQPQAFTSSPMLAMLDMSELKALARKHGKRMADLLAQERKARRQHKSYYAYSVERGVVLKALREVQRAYRRRIELMKMRGLA